MYSVSAEELHAALKDFYQLTRFKIVLYDAERRVLASYPDEMCRFCMAVRRSEALAHKCFDCDRAGFDACLKSGKPYIYECHMGLTEATAPILDGDELVGYLMFGQILPCDKEDVCRRAEEAAKKHGIPYEPKMLEEMPLAEKQTVRAAANVLSMCAGYLRAAELLRRNSEALARQLREYIVQNLDGDLDMDTLCRRFYSSRGRLYKVAMASFGMGVSDYVRRQRMERARELLRRTNEPVWRIGACVGYGDANYFVRAFKREMGITPLGYRKRHGGI